MKSVTGELWHSTLPDRGSLPPVRGVMDDLTRCYLIICLFMISVASTAPAQVAIYEEDFSSDPGWLTDQPANFYWDGAEEAYFARTLNGRPEYTPNRYTYTSLPLDPTQPFELQWDQKMLSAGIGTRSPFGLMSPDLMVSNVTYNYLPHLIPESAVNLWMGAYTNPMPASSSIGVNAIDASGYNAGFGAYGGGHYSLDLWYRNALQYDPLANSINWSITERDSGNLIFSGVRTFLSSAGFSSNMVNLGVGNDPSGYLPNQLSTNNPDEYAEALFDNIRLLVPVTTPHPPPSNNQPPIADFACPETADSGEHVTFDGSGSTDPDGTIVSYEWDFGDGETAIGSNVTHRFRGAMNEGKTYQVRLTVRDNDVATSNHSTSVTVWPLKRYMGVYSSLSPHLPVPTPPIIEITVYYNWTDEIQGQDEYVVSQVHLNNKDSLNFSLYWFSIKDDGEVIWFKIHKGFRKEDVSFAYPFNEPRDCIKTIGDDHFEGLAVGPNSNLNFLVHGVELGLSLMPSFFRASRTIDLGPGNNTEMPSIYPDVDVAGRLGTVASPVELRVYDSEANVTGLFNGETKEEISDSIYVNEAETAVIFDSTDSYRWAVVGTDEGTYDLNLISVYDGQSNAFEAIDILTLPGSIHEYRIDWAALSAGEDDAVVLGIDVDGDGEFEQTVTTGATFSGTEAQLWMTPPILHRRRGVPRVMAMLRLPEGVTADQLDMDQPLMLYPGGIEATYQYACEWGGRRAKRTTIFAHFDKDALMDAVPGDGSVELKVTGSLGTHQYFYGSDTVRIGNWRRWNHKWDYDYLGTN